MSSRNPEKTKMAPTMSGLKPYENALGASGSLTTIREYGRPAMTCDGADQLLFISWHTYLAVRGRRHRGCSVGGGSGSSSSSRSSQTGTRDLLSPSLRYHCLKAAEGVPDPSVVPVRGWYDFWCAMLGDDLGDSSIWAPQLHEHCFSTPHSCTKGNGPTAHSDPSPSSPDPYAQMAQRLAQHNRCRCIFLIPPFLFFLSVSHDNDGTDP